MNVIQSAMGLSVTGKIVLSLRIAAVIVGSYFFFGGKPPAKAQPSYIAPVTSPVATVITSEDSQQDIALSKINEWHIEQQGYNAETGARVQELNRRVDKLADDNATLQGIVKGGMGLLTALTGFAVFFQLKGKKAV